MVYCTPAFGMAWYKREVKPDGGIRLTPCHKGRATKETQKMLQEVHLQLLGTPPSKAPFIMADCPQTGFHYKAYTEMDAADPNFAAKLLDALNKGPKSNLIKQFETAAKKHLDNYKAVWN